MTTEQALTAAEATDEQIEALIVGLTGVKKQRWFVRAEVEAIILALHRPEQAEKGWQPIETAPQNADASLLGAAGNYVGEIFWHDGSQCYGHRGEAGWFWESDRGNLLTASNACVTHWMLMPAAPAIDSIKGGQHD